MPKRISLPIKEWAGYEWAELSVHGPDHVICGYKFRLKDESYSFAGGHRVRLYSVKGNVHWRIPEKAITVDVSAVPAAPNATAPRRTQRS